jgi:hypothetical protein
MQAEIQQVAKASDVDFVVGCVDTRKARKVIDQWVRKSRVLYWLDLGNSAAAGQFILGQPRNTINRNKKYRLPTVAYKLRGLKSSFVEVDSFSCIPDNETRDQDMKSVRHGFCVTCHTVSPP